jgi:type II secretion system protein H
MESQHGFTLVELLVVMFIVVVMTGFVTLAIRGGDQETILDSEVQTFLRKAIFAQEEMLFRHDPLGIYFDEHGYRYFRLQKLKVENPDVYDIALPETRYQWVSLKDRLLTEHHFRDGVGVSLYLEGNPVVLEKEYREEDQEITPQVTFLPDTDALPFELLFSYADAPRRSIVRFPSGRIQEQNE